MRTLLILALSAFALYHLDLLVRDFTVAERVFEQRLAHDLR